MLVTGYDYAAPPLTVMARIGAALLFAIETALRAGEICALTWADVDLDRRTVTVTAISAGARKGGFRVGRVVPLSVEAVRLLVQLQGIDAEKVFALEAPSLSVLFAKACRRALLEDLHFHDSRREALTRLAAKVDVMTLAKISGHRDLRILLSTYYQPDMADVAAKLG
jgi:integrase